MANKKIKATLNGIEVSFNASWEGASKLMELLLSAADDERRRGHLQTHERLMKEREEIFKQCKGL